MAHPFYSAFKILMACVFSSVDFLVLGVYAFLTGGFSNYVSALGELRIGYLLSVVGHNFWTACSIDWGISSVGN